MSQTFSRHSVVMAARTWLDTPFHHQARLKGVGVDCVGLVIGVARELTMVAPDFDIGGYPRVPDGRSFLGLAHLHMVQIEREAMQLGDVVVVSFDADPQHIAILGDYRHGGLSIIHAASDGSGGGRVLETRLWFNEAMRFCAAFQLPGVV